MNKATLTEQIVELARGPLLDQESSYKDASGIDFDDRHDVKKTSSRDALVGDKDRFEEIFRAMVPPVKK